jgi:hypothetical protein
MGVMGMSSLSTDGGGMSSAWFTDHSPGGGRVGAIVLWRHKPKPGNQSEPRRIRFPLLHMLIGVTLMKTGIFPRLWRRGFDAWLHGSFKAAEAWRAEAMAEFPPADPEEDRWTSSSGTGNDKVRYSDRRRQVGVRGRVFGPPPEGQAIVLLIEDDDTAADGIRIIERTVVIPAPPQIPPPDSGMSKEERMQHIRSRHANQQAALETALAADPAYEEFVRRSAD